MTLVHNHNHKMKKIKPTLTTPIQLGAAYADSITGASGIAIVISTHYNNTTMVALQPTATENGGVLPAEHWIDWASLTTAPSPKQPDYHGVELVDEITGFKGVAVCTLQHVTRCNQVMLQPRAIDATSGKPLGTETFDDFRVVPKLKKEKKEAPSAKANGSCSLRSMPPHR